MDGGLVPALGLVLIEVLIVAFGVGLAVIGYSVRRSGGDTSEVAIPLALVPMLLAGAGTLETGAAGTIDGVPIPAPPR